MIDLMKNLNSKIELTESDKEQIKQLDSFVKLAKYLTNSVLPLPVSPETIILQWPSTHLIKKSCNSKVIYFVYEIL